MAGQVANDIITVGSATKDGIKDVVHEIMPYLEQVADKIGTTAQYLWVMQIKQGYILAGALCIRYLLTLIILITIGRWLTKQNFNENNPFPFFVGLGLVVASVFWIGGFLSDISLILTLIFNPEYWAMQQVILLLKANIHF